MSELNDTEQQQPELIEFDDVINNPNYPPWPVEVVSKWRIGSQLRHALETESAVIGHKQGAIEFIRLMKTIEQEDMQKIYPRDIDIILEIMCTFDRCDLLKLLIEHQYISDLLRPNKNKKVSSTFGVNDLDETESNQSNTKQIKSKVSNPLQSTLKKAIRGGNIKMLNYLISQDIIPIKLFDNEQIQSKNYESDLKSLLYNILRGIAIGSKHINKEMSSNCYKCADRFWPYLATKVHDLKQSMFTNKAQNEVNEQNEKQALQKLMSSDDKNDEWMDKMKAMNDDYLIIKYMAMFMNTMFSRKHMTNDQLMAIFDVLRFQRERFITFEDRKDMKENRNAWKILYAQIVLNYTESSYSESISNTCVELQMIDYLVSGGISINDADRASIKNNKWLQKSIANGENNWKMKNASVETIMSMMPCLLPLEINTLIIFMLCL